jgi:hypothetical protein
MCSDAPVANATTVRARLAGRLPAGGLAIGLVAGDAHAATISELTQKPGLAGASAAPSACARRRPRWEVPARWR